MTKQLSLNMDYGISKEQACILCHLSSECAGCCAKCRAENKNGSCYGQNCSIPTMDYDGQRWNAWMHIVSTSLPELKRFIPVKYRKYLKAKKKMKKEDIEKAAGGYSGKILGINHKAVENEYNAFIAGAEWRINIVWYKPTIEAIRDKDILIEDVRGKFTVHKFYLEKWGNMVKIYEIKRWAYVEDLLPNMEE